MDGIAAKRVLIALAKKFAFDNVRRANRDRQFTLKLVTKSRIARHLMVRPIGSVDTAAFTVMTCKSGKWEQLLNALVGKEVKTIGTISRRNGTDAISNKIISVYSVEQLAIDLELEGHLKHV